MAVPLAFPKPEMGGRKRTKGGGEEEKERGGERKAGNPESTIHALARGACLGKPKTGMPKKQGQGEWK